MFRRKNDHNPKTVTEHLDDLKLPDHIRNHIDVKRAEVQGSRGIGLFIQHVLSLAGVVAAGFVTVHLLTEKGDLHWSVAILAALVLDAFAIMMAEMATRARLRGQMAIFTRAGVYLGAAASISLNIMFPFNEVLMYAIPGVIVLGTIAWVTGVRDKHAAVFVALDLVAKERRKKRWEQVRKFLAYLFAVGLFGKAEKRHKKTGEVIRPAKVGAIGAMRQRAAELGTAERSVDHTLALRQLAAKQEIGTAQVEAEVAAAVEPTRRGPYPPTMRPVSGAPLEVQGDDDLAAFLDGCADKSDAVRQLMTAWYANYQRRQADLFGIPFQVVNSAVHLIRLLDPYNVRPGESTVKNIKRDLIAKGKFPTPDQAREIRGIVDGEVAEAAITAA